MDQFTSQNVECGDFVVNVLKFCSIALVTYIIVS